ncbi:MAG: 2,3-bisphosphoglycerate-independent phosphoglycerate mutase [bacterium]
MVKQTVILTILDGWGIGRKDSSNPIFTANPPTVEYIKHTYTIGSLQASGIAVGLPWGEESNSQVGHLMIGAGKILYQHLPRITLAIKTGKFFSNQVLINAFTHTQEKQSCLHLIGLLSEEQVHSSIDHLIALFQYADTVSFPREKIMLHIIVNQKESVPDDIYRPLKKLQESIGPVQIASISGSYFAMDTDRRWDRTTKTYEAMTELPYGDISITAQSIIETFHERNLANEFIKPTLLLKNGVVMSNDSVIFFNFRESSMRQLVQLFLDPSFSHVENTDTATPLSKKENMYIATFTEYSKSFPVAVAFPPESITEPLGKVLADNGKIQLRIAETERYPHVTFFFNGLRQEPFQNEYRILIPSRDTPDQRAFPEMMAESITARALTAIHELAYDFILVNYANADSMAQTGDYNAVLSAIHCIDAQIQKLMDAVLATNSILIITSGHGNAERVRNPYTGTPEIKNDPNPVPFYIVGNAFKHKKSSETADMLEHENVGVISDVAPTILSLLHLPQPTSMTGIDILSMLR